MATAPKQRPSPQAILDEFVFHPDQFFGERVPRGLDPADVARFVEARIDHNTPPAAALQLERVIDFYDAQEALTALEKLLDRREVTEAEVQRSIYYLRAFGYAGTPDQLAFARDYYAYLGNRANTLDAFADLIVLFDALGPGADRKVVVDAVNRRLQTLTPRRATDERVEKTCQRLEQILQRDLPNAEKAAAEKEKILKITTRPRRIREEIKVYMEVEYGYLDSLHPWSARRLRREVWGEHPDSQTVRRSEKTRRVEVVEAFRQMLSSLDQFKGISKEDRPGAEVRCLRAIEFFGGKLTPEEREFLNNNGGMQYDILWGERQLGLASTSEAQDD